MFGLTGSKRLVQITRILFKYELQHIINKANLTHHLPLHQRFKTKEEKEVDPVLLRKVFEELGGAFLKLGQLLALRPDLIGKDYSKELEKLLLDVEAQDFKDLKEKLKYIPIEEIQTIPIGCGSIAQVYKARLENKIVAIKVKRNGVDELFREDIEIMELIAKSIQKSDKVSFLNLNEIVNEFKVYTKKELDFNNEVRSLEIFHNNFKGSKEIKIPKVYEKYSNSQVVVMEFISGKDILNSKHKKGVIEKVTNSVYKMLFEDKFFHADLHPGNIFVEGDKIAYLDFGIVGRIDSVLEKNLFNLFSSLVNADLEGTTKALVSLHIGNKKVNQEILKNGIEEVLGPYYNTSLKNMNFEKIFYGSIEVARESKIKLPSNIVLFGKSLVTMEGFCREVDPNFNIVESAKPYVKKIIQKRTSPKEVSKVIINNSKYLLQTAMEFPDIVKDFSNKFSSIEKQTSDIDETINNFSRELHHIARMIIATSFFAVFFLSGVLLIDMQPSVTGVSYLSVILFILSFAMLSQLVISMIKH